MIIFTNKTKPTQTKMKKRNDNKNGGKKHRILMVNLLFASNQDHDHCFSFPPSSLTPFIVQICTHWVSFVATKMINYLHTINYLLEIPQFVCFLSVLWNLNGTFRFYHRIKCARQNEHCFYAGKAAKKSHSIVCVDARTNDQTHKHIVSHFLVDRYHKAIVSGENE